MVVGQGEVWWADLPSRTGSEPGFRSPVVVVESDDLTRSCLATVVCVPLTSNLKYAEAPGNVLLSARAAGLPKDSVANPTHIVSLDKELLTERIAKLSQNAMDSILGGIDIVLER